jgi:hypothetical protein
MLNFNVDPYYDDFDPNKNYHRVLFKPGRAVQARELTQSQTILQNQISNFADHFFNQNTPVKGGEVTINTKIKYIKLNSTFNDIDVVASSFLNQIVSDDSGTVLAKVIAADEGSSGGDPPTLVVSYFSGVEFANSANIISQTSSVVAQSISADATGSASVASIANGVFYVVNGYNFSSEQNPDGTFSRYSIGNFVAIQPQTIIIGKYTNTPNVRVGLDISEYISDYVTDSSLLDPAVGATNYQAPGADRYTIDLDLTTKSLTASTINDQNFIELVRVENGTIVRQVNGTSYSAIDDYLAKRTYETNGDYIVRNFKIDAYANTVPGGNNEYILSVGAGVAYVQGYRAENQSPLRLRGNRARTTSSVNNNTITPSYGNYLYVNTLRGANGSFIDVTQSDSVDFHLGNVSTVNTISSIVYNSTVAATGRVRSIQYQGSSNTDSTNTISYIYKAHVYDIATKSLSSNASSGTSTTITFYDPTNKFSDKSNVYTGTTIVLTGGPGQGDIRTITEYDGATKVAKVDTTFSTTPTTSTNFSLNFGINNINSIIKAAPGLSSNLVMYGQATVDVLSKSGSPATLSSPTVLTDADDPQMIFEVGQAFVSTTSDSSYESLQEYRGTSFGTTTGGIQGQLSMSGSFSSVANFIRTGTTESSDSIRENFIVIATDGKTNANVAKGDIIQFTNSPTRTVTVDAGKNTATFFAADLQPFDATVFAKVNIINADNSSVIRRTKTLVQANTTSLGIAGTSGTVNGVLIDLTKGQIYIPTPPADGYATPQSLYVTDIKRIKKIVSVGTSAPVIGDYSDTTKDVTSLFIFDNGQRDSYYDHASIRIRSGGPKLGGIWILFDHYTHSGGDGYFNVNSYANENYVEIPSYTNSKGVTYQLRDCIDFRPSRTNATSSFTFKYSVTPTTTNQYGSLLPIDTSSFTSDYSFYLGRKDLLVLTKDAEFVLAEGVPSTIPQFPPDPSNGLVLARLTLDPYTAYMPGDIPGVSSISVVPVQHKNWQMKDITAINDRINNIEYYSALNLLEQNSLNLQIPDGLGLNRFKNGILVDNFSTYGIADTFNSSFNASINTRKGILTASKTVRNFQLVNSVALNNKNYGILSLDYQNSAGFRIHKVGATNVLTLPYTEEPVVKQTLASRTQDVNAFSSWNVEGFIELTPPMDNWVDTIREPSLLFVDPNLKTYRAINQLQVLQEGDWQSIPGTRVEGEKFYETQFTGFKTVSETRSATDYLGNYSLTNGITSSYVTNVSLTPYIRQQQIQFVATGLKTNNLINAYFNTARITRLIRRPNVLRCTNITGKFNAGDVIGYKPTTSSFVKTGTVLSATNLSSTSQILYVIDDMDSSAYTTGGFTTLHNATFDNNGTYSSSTASVSISNVTQTHYAGKISNAATGVITSNQITLDAKASSVNDFYNGMFFNIVSGSYEGMTAIGLGGFVKITAYNGTTKVATLGGTISFKNGDVYSIGESNNNELKTDEAGNVSGVFYVPPSVFPTGERTFRLDDRQVQYLGSSKFINYAGTEKTYAQATFISQGLIQKVVDVEYSPSISTTKKVITQNRYNTFAVDRTYFNETPPPAPPPPAINYDAGTPYTPIEPAGNYEGPNGPGGTIIGPSGIEGPSQSFAFEDGSILSIDPAGNVTTTPATNNDGNGGECFTASTLIDMFDGTQKQICDIQMGDLVKDALTGKANKVIGVKVTEYETGRRIFATRKGEEAYITEQHAFYNENNELCAISSECEYLAPWLGPIKIVNVPVIEVVKEPITVYNLMFETGNSHFANGLPVSNMVETGGTYILLMKGLITKEEYEGYIYHLENTVGLNALEQEHKAKIFKIVLGMSKYILQNDNIRSKMLAKFMSWGIRNRERLYPYLEKWLKSKVRKFIFGRK